MILFHASCLGGYRQRSFRTSGTCMERFVFNVFSVTARVHLDSSLGFSKEQKAVWCDYARLLPAFHGVGKCGQYVYSMRWLSATAAPRLSICMLILLSTVMGSLTSRFYNPGVNNSPQYSYLAGLLTDWGVFWPKHLLSLPVWHVKQQEVVFLCIGRFIQPNT